MVASWQRWQGNDTILHGPKAKQAGVKSTRAEVMLMGVELKHGIPQRVLLINPRCNTAAPLITHAANFLLKDTRQIFHVLCRQAEGSEQQFSCPNPKLQDQHFLHQFFSPRWFHASPHCLASSTFWKLFRHKRSLRLDPKTRNRLGQNI